MDQNMHASDWPRASFAEAAMPVSGQLLASSHMFGNVNHGIFQANLSAGLQNTTQPVLPPSPQVTPVLPMPVHNVIQNHLHHHLNHHSLDLDLQQQLLSVPETANGVVPQSVAELNKNPARIKGDCQVVPEKKQKVKVNRSMFNGFQQIQKREKRPSNPSEWKKKKKKSQRDQGKEYITLGGKIQKARCVQLVDCSKCRYRCSEKIPEEARKAIHKVYWSLASYERQRAFIAQHVEQNDIKQVKSKSSLRRGVAHSFFFVHERKQHRVCKAFFTKTLDITTTVVDYTMKRTQGGVYVGRDERGRRDPINKTKPEDIEFVHSHIDSFPTVDGAKGKKDKKKKKGQLSQDLNVKKMHKMYKDACEQTGLKAVGISVYRQIFNKDFNLSFRAPTKDHCAGCRCNSGEGSKKVDSEVMDQCATFSLKTNLTVPEQQTFFHH